MTFLGEREKVKHKDKAGQRELRRQPGRFIKAVKTEPPKSWGKKVEEIYRHEPQG